MKGNWNSAHSNKKRGIKDGRNESGNFETLNNYNMPSCFANNFWKCVFNTGIDVSS